jgi:acetyl-CoA carboxylase carboxyl transferase subunit alpha
MTTAYAPAPGALLHANGGGYLEFEKSLLQIQQDLDTLQRQQEQTGSDLVDEIRRQRLRLLNQTRRLYGNLTPWETVLVARHPQRPLTPDYIPRICRDFAELHGDRLFSDDRAIISGFGRIGGHKVMLIGHNKGKDLKERIACNFGCAHPEGYRKALRRMKLAEKFGLPVVCLIDTQGAYPGVGAEERGIAHAIAVNLMEMSRLRTPVVCVVIGEGGSGGALGIGVGDRVAMFAHSFYSVISPEGCAAILWKTAERKKHAAEALHLTARALRDLDIIDAIIPEPLGGAHRNPQQAAENLEKYITESLNVLKGRTIDALVRARYLRIRRFGGHFTEPAPVETPTRRAASTPRRSAPRTTRVRRSSKPVPAEVLA